MYLIYIYIYTYTVYHICISIYYNLSAFDHILSFRRFIELRCSHLILLFSLLVDYKCYYSSISRVSQSAAVLPGSKLQWNLNPTGLLEVLHHLQHRHARACSQVVHQVRAAARLLQQLVQRLHVALGQILHVDVVADSCPVSRVPVCPKHAEHRAAADRHLLDGGQQVHGSVAPLAYQA